MSWSLKIGSIAGTAVRIHITFILFLAWIFGASYVWGGPNAAWSSLLFVVLLFLCVLAHEFGHILTARAFGVLTPDVILLPIGGVARLERIPEKPLEEFLIAIAGPLVNVVIAFGLTPPRHISTLPKATLWPVCTRLGTCRYTAITDALCNLLAQGARVSGGAKHPQIADEHRAISSRRGKSSPHRNYDFPFGVSAFDVG
jgi:Zn-dependent protease